MTDWYKPQYICQARKPRTENEFVYWAEISPFKAGWTIDRSKATLFSNMQVGTYIKPDGHDVKWIKLTQEELDYREGDCGMNHPVQDNV